MTMQSVFSFSEDSRFHDERQQVLDAIKDNDKETWQKFHASKFFMREPMTYAGLMILENNLERAGKLQFDGDWDAAWAAAVDFYTQFYIVIGVPLDQAQKKAEELAKQSGVGGGVSGLGLLL